MFDILGGFVVKFIPPESRDRLRATLSGLAFDCVELDGGQIDGKSALHAALYRAMNFEAFWSPYQDPPNWDSLSDLLWQWVMGEAGHEVTKLAFVIENGSILLSRAPQLVFDFAETCIHLETIVRDARAEEREPPLLVRIFLVG
jgi:hypothetical protein